jgi:hypothetical protein
MRIAAFGSVYRAVLLSHYSPTEHYSVCIEDYPLASIVSMMLVLAPFLVNVCPHVEQ